MSEAAEPRRSTSPTLAGFACLLGMFVAMGAGPTSAVFCAFPLFVAALVLSFVALMRGETIGGVALLLVTFGGGFAGCLAGCFVGAAVGAV